MEGRIQTSLLFGLQKGENPANKDLVFFTPHLSENLNKQLIHIYFAMDESVNKHESAFPTFLM